MPFFEILLIAISMAMDAFMVCLAAGALEKNSAVRARSFGFPFTSAYSNSLCR